MVYILPIGWLHGTYHLLREPGNSIETVYLPIHEWLIFMVSKKV